MAAKKTAAKKAASPSVNTRPGQSLTRDTSNVPDPLDPSRPLVNRAPEFGDMNRAAQDQVLQHVAEAGTEAYGVPITMGDAVRARVDSIERGIAAAPSGIPESVTWYGNQGHLGELRSIYEQSGVHPDSVSIASAVDAAASASQRNSPENEVEAVKSGLSNIVRPDRQIRVTTRQARATNESTARGKPFLSPEHHITAGTHSVGHLSVDQLAALNQVATTTHTKKSAQETNDAAPDAKPVKAGDLVHGKNFIPAEVTNITGRVSSRDTSVKVMRNLQGVPMSETWGDAPKLTSYRRGFSTISDAEDAYNKSVLARRRDAINNPGQGVLFSASEETGFDPSLADTATAEDYVMQALTAHAAAEGGTTGKRARDAQNIVNVKKGKVNQGITTDLTPKEAFHAFNNEATRRAAEQINYSTFGRTGSVLSEHITSKASQPMAWIPYRRDVLKEDKEWNKDQAMRVAHASALSKLDKQQADAQGTLIDAQGRAKVTPGKLKTTKDKDGNSVVVPPRFTKAEQEALEFAKSNPNWTGRDGLDPQ